MQLSLRSRCCVLVWGLTWGACSEESVRGATPIVDAGATGGPTHDAQVEAGAPVSPYVAVEALVRRSCSFTSCHGGDGVGKARLNFAKVLAAGDSLTTVLNGVASCEYPRMQLVKPSAPDESWLMVKLTAEHDADGKIAFTPDAAWDAGVGADSPPSTCPLVVDGELSFGQLMPISGTRSRALPEEEIEVFRAWIAAGALGE